MALQLDKVLDTGVIGTYFTIGKLYGNCDTNTLDIRIDLYLAKANADAGNEFLSSKWYTMPATVESFATSNPWQLAYTYLKTLPEFSGALDV